MHFSGGLIVYIAANPFFAGHKPKKRAETSNMQKGACVGHAPIPQGDAVIPPPDRKNKAHATQHGNPANPILGILNVIGQEVNSKD